MNKEHIYNIKESFLFLSICRDTLCEMYDNEEIKYFIKNEASDYQIISMIVDGKIPTAKYNLKEEKKQWEIFQQTVCDNSEMFIEMGPIIEYGLTSNRTINSFLSEVSGDQGKYVQGLYDNMKSSMKDVKSAVNKEKSKVDPNTSMDKLAVGTSAGAAASVIKFSAAKLYKDFLTKNIPTCKGRPDKSTCMKQVRSRALAMRIEKVKSGMSVCNKAKNADACKRSLQKHLNKLQLRTKK